MPSWAATVFMVCVTAALRLRSALGGVPSASTRVASATAATTPAFQVRRSFAVNSSPTASRTASLTSSAVTSCQTVSRLRVARHASSSSPPPRRRLSDVTSRWVAPSAIVRWRCTPAFAT